MISCWPQNAAQACVTCLESFSRVGAYGYIRLHGRLLVASLFAPARLRWTSRKSCWRWLVACPLPKKNRQNLTRHDNAYNFRSWACRCACGCYMVLSRCFFNCASGPENTEATHCQYPQKQQLHHSCTSTSITSESASAAATTTTTIAEAAAVVAATPATMLLLFRCNMRRAYNSRILGLVTAVSEHVQQSYCQDNDA